MWFLAAVNSPSTVWCSDGKPISTVRGGVGDSSRLIIDQQGFLDLTELDSMEEDEPYVFIDEDLNPIDEETSTAYGEYLDLCLTYVWYSDWLRAAIDANGLRLGDLSDSPLALHLTIDTDGKFALCVNLRAPRRGVYTIGILDP